MEPFTPRPAEPVGTRDRGPTMQAVFAWLAAESGSSSPETVRASPGLDILRAMPNGRMPIGHALNFSLVEAARGRVVFAGTPTFEHYNPIGWVHGGWAATLLDSAMGGAVCSLLEGGKLLTTVELKVNYVRPLTDEMGPLRAVGEVISAGRTIATAEGRLLDADGRLYAHGTTTCLILADPSGR